MSFIAMRLTKMVVVAIDNIHHNEGDCYDVNKLMMVKAMPIGGGSDKYR